MNDANLPIKNIRIEFIPSPPKMYAVGDKVKYKGTVEIVTATSNEAPSLELFCYYLRGENEPVSHFDLEPVFEDDKLKEEKV